MVDDNISYDTVAVCCEAMMIKLTKLNGTEFFLNPALMERVDVTPNTVITMNSQIQYIVKESVDMINSLIRDDRV